MSRLCLLGPPALHSGDSSLRFTPERRYQLLALLALHEGAWVERDLIAALFWPEHGSADARRNLRKVVFDARAVPGVMALEATDRALRWPVSSDLQDFRQALRERRPADAAACAADWPCPGIDDGANAALSGWFTAERTRLLQAWQQAAHERLPTLVDAAQRLALVQRLLAQDPLDEVAVAAQVSDALARGETATAQRLYRAYAEGLQAELGIAPSNALRDLLDAPPLAPARPTGAAAGAAPTASSFVGRGSELAELAALLSRPECRMLTLLGPGGVGKSRLAQQAQQRSAATFPGGCWWTELQDLDGTAALTARVAAQLGVEINDTRDALAQLARALPTERSLLVLDNAEHLAELPGWADRLLAAAPGLSLLFTSRQRLHGHGEWLLPLQGLALPDDESRDFDAARSFDAVRLFETRARAARPDFEMARHLAAVLDIVDTVGGLPLAIELAASWVRLLPPEEIARELRLSLELLQSDPQRHAPAARPEHHSMLATLEGSWARLSPRERETLTAATVFDGGFTRAAALAVTGAGLPLLAALADRSLLQVDEAGRFGMHPLAAAWAAARLAQQPARAAALRDAHARHHAQALHALAPLARSSPRGLIDQMRPEQANWTAAWRHAVQAGLPDMWCPMLPALLAFFETQGRWNEGLALLRPALAAAAQDAAGRLGQARARATVASLLYRRGDLREAEALARDAVRLGREIGDTDAELGGLNNLGLSLWNQGRNDEAVPEVERMLELARGSGDTRTVARALSTLALAEKALGRYDSALQRQTEALALQRALGSPPGIATALNNIGNLYRVQRRYREALPSFEEGLQLCTAERLESQRPFLSLNLGLTLFELGTAERARAATLLEQTLLDVRRSGQPQAEITTLMGLARCAMAAHDVNAALTRLRMALALSEAKSFHATKLDILGIYAECCSARGDAALARVLWQLVASHPAPDEVVRAEAREQLLRLAPHEGDAPAPLDEEEALALLRGSADRTMKR